jgi:hypothetical protein
MDLFSREVKPLITSLAVKLPKSRRPCANFALSERSFRVQVLPSTFAGITASDECSSCGTRHEVPEELPRQSAGGFTRTGV